MKAYEIPDFMNKEIRKTSWGKDVYIHWSPEWKEWHWSDSREYKESKELFRCDDWEEYKNPDEHWDQRTQPKYGSSKESIHWHKHHHPKCGGCEYFSDRYISNTTPGYELGNGWCCHMDGMMIRPDFYCAKWEKKDE